MLVRLDRRVVVALAGEGEGEFDPQEEELEFNLIHSMSSNSSGKESGELEIQIVLRGNLINKKKTVPRITTDFYAVV